MVSGSCSFSAFNPPCGIENGLWAEIDLLQFLVELEHREVDDPAELEALGINQAQVLAELGAHGTASFAAGSFLSAAKNTASPSVQPVSARNFARRTSSRFLAIGPLPPPASKIT